MYQYFQLCTKDNTLFDVLIHVVVNDSAMLSMSFLFFFTFCKKFCTHIYKMFVIFFHSLTIFVPISHCALKQINLAFI